MQNRDMSTTDDGDRGGGAPDRQAGRRILQFFVCASVVIACAAVAMSVHDAFAGFPPDARADAVMDARADAVMDARADAVMDARAVPPIIPVSASSIDGLLDRMQSAASSARDDDTAPTSWRLGDGLQSGDSFTYRICGSEHAVQFAYPHDCYTARADFIYRTIHHAYGDAGVTGGLIWIVDASFYTPDKNRRTVLFVDERMNVHATSQYDRQLADSLEHTIMRLAEYGRQNLSVGSHWGDIKTHFTSVPLSVISWDGDRTATLGYDVGEYESRTQIWADTPLPPYSKWYEPNDALPSEPRLLHEFVLLGRE